MTSNIQSFWIPGVLPGQNAIIDASKNIKLVKGFNGRRKVWSQYAVLKKKWTDFIVACVLSMGSPSSEGGGLHFWYIVSEPNRKRDPSNAAMGAIKFIEDALQVAGVIPDDGWKDVLSISLTFLHAPTNPGVLVMMTPERSNEHEALSQYVEKSRLGVPRTPQVTEALRALMELPKRSRSKSRRKKSFWKSMK